MVVSKMGLRYFGDGIIDGDIVIWIGYHNFDEGIIDWAEGL